MACVPCMLFLQFCWPLNSSSSSWPLCPGGSSIHAGQQQQLRVSVLISGMKCKKSSQSALPALIRHILPAARQQQQQHRLCICMPAAMYPRQGCVPTLAWSAWFQDLAGLHACSTFATSTSSPRHNHTLDSAPALPVCMQPLLLPLVMR